MERCAHVPTHAGGSASEKSDWHFIGALVVMGWGVDAGAGDETERCAHVPTHVGGSASEKRDWHFIGAVVVMGWGVERERGGRQGGVRPRADTRGRQCKRKKGLAL
jgi:hypothetical protein